ncbi:MAG TPA: phosphomannomutase [Candidatus Binatia bacterium]|nr:phosphomannomutase [Candidatus Binatia bacterium]
MAAEASFLNYTPVPLAFGTSGLRGLVKDITDLEAYINVKATLRYLLRIGDIDAGSTVVVAGDLRPSTERILRACARAILDAGCRVENAGRIPTPALLFHCLSTRRAGVMVTGSHIPFDRNGIKINKTVGELLKSDEPGILAEVERVRREEYGRSAADSAFDPRGMLKTTVALPPPNSAAEEAYVRRYLDCFRSGALAGLRVFVYQHSAVGRDFLPRLLRQLGAEVVAGGRSDAFIPIDTENVTDEQLDRLDEFVVAYGSQSAPLDAIVSTDGDSDRPLVAAVLGASAPKPGARRVRFLPGDLLGIVVAEYLRADAAAVPISANDAVERRMAERQVALEKTKIGSPYVIAAMENLRARNARRVVGWEANGGFLTGSDIALKESVLTALPTRDSTLPILANLTAAAEQKISLSALWDRLPARFGRAGLLDDFPADASRAILRRLIPPGETIEVAFHGDDEVVDRSRAGVPAEPLAPHRAAEWRERRALLSRFFTPTLGFDEIVRINVLDGVRVYFRNGDIAHIRPSGNAPQLRIYANADSQARADRIVEYAVREPDGILRQLERALA